MDREVIASCTECGSPMEDGAIVDFRRNSVGTAEWVAGDVVTSPWTGAVKNPVRLRIRAYRCVACGFLKLYAREPSSGSQWS